VTLGANAEITRCYFARILKLFLKYPLKEPAIYRPGILPGFLIIPHKVPEMSGPRTLSGY
jgi:hypothetical protein